MTRLCRPAGGPCSDDRTCRPVGRPRTPVAAGPGCEPVSCHCRASAFPRGRAARGKAPPRPRHGGGSTGAESGQVRLAVTSERSAARPPLPRPPVCRSRRRSLRRPGLCSARLPGLCGSSWLPACDRHTRERDQCGGWRPSGCGPARMIAMSQVGMSERNRWWQ